VLSTRFEAAGLEAGVFVDMAGCRDGTLALSATRPSVSWTGRSAVKGATGGAAVADGAGADVAARGVGTAFWREAR
jgi:hypothetical protein